METPELNPSRYTDIDGVTINDAYAPSTFRHLIDDAIEWSIGDDVERHNYMASLTSDQLKLLIETVSPHLHQIREWCRSCRNQEPVPDEAIIFDHLLEAVAEASISLDQ